MSSQKEVVFTAVTAVIGVTDGEQVKLTADQRSQIVKIITDAILSGDMSMKDAAKEKYSTEKSARKYANELLSNWLKKDTRLNGGAKYQSKRSPALKSVDSVLANLMVLLQNIRKDPDADPTAEASVLKEIEDRKVELGLIKRPEIDVEALPAHLRSMVDETQE